jgi:excisionase family DNA binding protein
MPTPKCQNKAPKSSALLTTQEAAAIAKVSVRRVQAWVKTERLRAVQQHPKILIHWEDLDRFLRNRRSPAGSIVELATDDKGEIPHLLTANEAATIAKVDASTVRRWVARDHLPVVQRQPLTLIDPEQLHQFLRHRKPSPSTSPKTHSSTAETPVQDIAEVIAERDQLRHKIEAALAREQAALAREQAALAREQHLLDLLEHDDSQPFLTIMRGSRQDMPKLWEDILGYLRTHPEPQAPLTIQKALQLPKTPRYAMRRMLRAGLLKQPEPGKYILSE